MKRLVFLIPIVIFVGLAGIFTIRLGDVIKGEDIKMLPSVLINKQMAAFDLPPLPGRGKGLSSEDFKGQVSLLNFFGSWCVTCKVEHPFLMQIKAEGKVPLHGIDFNEPPERGLAWLMKDGDPYDRIGSDPKGRVPIDFGLTGAPETFIIDKAGVIRYRHQGALNQRVWDAEIWPRILELRK